MTNPSDAVGTNGAYGGRTSVDALNDVLGCFQGSGTLSGWYVRADSGMSVLVGGQSGVRDVAVAEDQLGDRTTVNNRLGSPISITLNASSPSTARVDSIVLYVNKPASVITTDIDNPGACGIIAVNGTTTAPSGADIRSAITADGGTGATAYYVVIADITIPASATVITQVNITNYNSGLIGRRAMAAGAIGTDQLANGAVTSSKIDWDTYYYQSGDVYDINDFDVIFAGRALTSGSEKRIFTLIQLYKPLSSGITTITFTPTSYNEAWGVSGTIYTFNNPTSSQLVFTCNRVSGAPNLVRVLIRILGSTSNFTPSTPCVINLHGKFTFS